MRGAWRGAWRGATCDVYAIYDGAIYDGAIYGGDDGIYRGRANGGWRGDGRANGGGVPLCGGGLSDV